MQKIMFNDRYGLTQAVIEGRKTITRREPIFSGSDNFTVSCWPDTMLKKEYVRFDFDNGVSHKCRYAIGEELAVAQSYKALGYDDDALDRDPKDVFHVRGTLGRSSGWNNKMFIRAEACKVHIRITNIRCERLQDISDADCLKEGIRFIPKIDKFYFEDGRREEGFYFDDHRVAFASLIDKVSGRGTWDRNLWVVVYEFELIKY